MGKIFLRRRMFAGSEDKSLDRNLADQLKVILEAEGVEEDLQRFLSDHPEVLAAAFIRIGGFVVPKFRFADDYVSDFLVADWPQMWTYTLVELEPKDAKAFNKDGTPGKRLATAIKQVSDWQQWIRKHPEYFKEKSREHINDLLGDSEANAILPERFREMLRHDDHFRTKHVIVIGRRGENFPDEQKHRDALYGLSSDSVTIHSYDWLLDLIRHNAAHGEGL